MNGVRRKRLKRRGLIAALAVAALIALPAIAFGHVERASYWPDPGADTSVTPAAGGAVPAVRNLFTALDGGQPGTTRVVCKTGNSVAGPGNPPSLPGSPSSGRQDQDVSRAELDRLSAQLNILRAGLKKKHGKAKRKQKRKIRRVRHSLTAAEQSYIDALVKENAARQQANQQKQADDDAFQQAQERYRQQLDAWLARYQTYQSNLATDPSMQAVAAGLSNAQASGYKLRPSQPAIQVSQAEGQRLYQYNGELLQHCAYDSIQAAVTDSGNNDRVEIMPGLYTEPDSRAAPTNDPDCASLKETNDKGNTGAVSHRYQAQCPNDQNLIAVIGREPGATNPPQPPTQDRHGIPDEGACVRCNLQIQGSGISPDDVIVEGGDTSLGDHGRLASDPAYPKDVGIRADRADGFVLDNVKVRHVNEHDVYVIETDGFHLDRLKTPYAGEYGVLTFVADHSLIENCDAWGNGDSGIYPGASADTGDDVQPPDTRRLGNELRNCDMHHNAAGYSGTDGNAVWVHNNDFYDNANGFTTDVFTAPGHPGFPQDSDLIENNRFYSNNFNPYLPRCTQAQVQAGLPGPHGPGQVCSDFAPSVPMPVGTGMWIAGGNHNTMRNNFFYDNWRRGTMLFAVPDQLVCGSGVGSVTPEQLDGCDPTAVPPSTSYNNEYYGNTMGRRPDGTQDPNGVDFWWDEFAGNTGNCWHDNVGKDGTRGTLTSDPPQGLAGQSVPGTLPENCGTSVGTQPSNPELLACFAEISGGPSGTCDWFTTPTEP